MCGVFLLVGAAMSSIEASIAGLLLLNAVWSVVGAVSWQHLRSTVMVTDPPRILEQSGVD
jgi:hypothetical protein